MKRYPLPLTVAPSEAMHLIEAMSRVIDPDRLGCLPPLENRHERVIDHISPNSSKFDIEKSAVGKAQRFPIADVSHPLPREER